MIIKIFLLNICNNYNIAKNEFNRMIILKYLRCYIQRIKLNQFFGKKIIKLFGLATILEIYEVYKKYSYMIKID